MATKVPVTKYFRPFIPPLPPGTKIHNDLYWDVYIYRPFCRLWERVGVYLYNRVINRMEIGVRDKGYNARVHGPYCPWRYYGVAKDTKLMDVKLCDLRSWLSRRDKSVGGIVNAVVKSFYRFEHYYFDHYLINLPRSCVRFVLLAYLLGIILCYDEIPASTARYHW
ncbi:unnamed protein product [Litomosoides sigmodontis]|uniref:ATP synthase subunit f, mitochondrial n=1 Tax=Litomosoides sigmodontis TaxID=42156 RepID=A0A3P6TKP3_LITSI|nr:unnamed protein product [Litomosoides sigmodontis]